MSFVIAMGCVGDPEIDLPEAAPPMDPVEGFVPYVAGEQEQGRHLLGSYADGFTTPALGHFHVSGAPISPLGLTVTVEGALLVARSGSTVAFSGVSAGFQNMRFTTSVGDQLEIVGMTWVSPTVVHYNLRHHTSAGSKAYCSSGAGAVPFKGRWSQAGAHIDDPATISFGCDDAVGFKCTSWGYIAGGGGPGTGGWNHHEACTRMARADYCGDGKSHTYEGTAIVIRDLIAGAMPNLDDPTVPALVEATEHPAPPSQFWFESAWQAATPPAVCLSRVRWASMPIGGPCPGVLDDPRVEAGALYCEDLWNDPEHVIGPRAPAILYNSSKVGQMLMHRWSTSSGQQLVTVRGWHDARGDDPPHPNYVKYEEPIGFLMRNPPSSLAGTLTPVHSLRDPSTTDRFVGVYDASSSYNIVGFEGYVFIDAVKPEAWMPDRLSLKLYRNGADRVSSTSAPLGGFFPVLQAPIGYIDEPTP